ncbi:hypothetical protein FACS1894132_06920 [Clostridia bacterium]|nr:hypothetical protein FACS1894132_06920 [Clostridia bacterium]
MRDIQPKHKSIQNLLEPEVASIPKFENLLGKEFGVNSPFVLRKEDFHEGDETLVPVINVARRDILQIRKDTKSGLLARGEFTNKNTGMAISFGKVGIDDTFNQSLIDTKRHIPTTARLSALYQAQELIENAVMLDSQISEYNPQKSKNKSPNSLFMHRLYVPITCQGGDYLARLAVEEIYKANKNGDVITTNNRLYNLKDIKITPIKLDKCFQSL